MAIEIRPQVMQDPVPSQTGRTAGRVVPVQDSSGGNLRALGEGATDLGRALTVMADRYQDHVDRAQAHRMRNLYDAEVEKERWAPGSGFLTTTGIDANPERRKQHEERLRQQRQKIAALGQNEAQRQSFTEYADRTDAESSLRADIHMVREARNYEAGETKVSAERRIEGAIGLAGTEEGAVRREEARRDLDRLADLYGWAKDSSQRAQLHQDANDTYHGGVLQRILDAKQVPMAEAYLRANDGEMSPAARSKAEKEVARRSALIADEARETAAWTYANNLANSGLSLTEQRAHLDAGVRAGTIDGETAAKAWSFARGFDDEKWQQTQRARSAFAQQLEQDFAKNPALDVDTLPTDVAATMDGLAMRGDAQRIHSTIRQRRIADALAEDDSASVRLSRDMRTYNDGERVIEILEGKRTAMKPEEVATPAGREKKARIERRIAEIQQLLDALETRPRSPTTADELAPSAPPDPKAPPFDMQKFTNDLKRALYPGAGR